MDVRDNSRLREVSVVADEFVELRVISDGEHDMTRHDPVLLDPLSLIPRELNNLRADVLESRCEVDGCPTSNAVSIAALLHEAGDSRDAELESRLHALAHARTTVGRRYRFYGRLIGNSLALALSFDLSSQCRRRKRSSSSLGGRRDLSLEKLGSGDVALAALAALWSVDGCLHDVSELVVLESLINY